MTDAPFLPLELPEPGSLKLEESFHKVSLVANGDSERTPAEAGAQLEVRVVRCDDVDLDGMQAVDNDSGAKVWEGGLELGAGHGLPGIVAAMRHGVRVDFHDRSPGVLRSVTLPNAAANGLGCPAEGCGAVGSRREPAAPSAASPGPPRFLAGDWRDLCSALQATGLKYDAVLAAEAIYRAEVYADLAALLDQCLAEGAVAWFAGKRFYFGCGGGTASFAAFLRERGFDVLVDRVIEDGRSNVREILRVTRHGGGPGGAAGGDAGAGDSGRAEEVASTDGSTPCGSSAGKRESGQPSEAGAGDSKHRRLTSPP